MAEHPSESAVLPSSQYVLASEPCIEPSPQMSEHVLEVDSVPAVHEKPDSIEHDALHPSPLIALPSSQ